MDMKRSMVANWQGAQTVGHAQTGDAQSATRQIAYSSPGDATTGAGQLAVDG